MKSFSWPIDTYVIIDRESIIRLVIHFKIKRMKKYTIVWVKEMKKKFKVKKPIEWTEFLPGLIQNRWSKFDPFNHHMIMTIDNYFLLKKGQKWKEK